MLGLTLMAAVGIAAGAQQAPERVCHREPPPDRPSRIEQYMADRKSFGFRSDEAYVRKLIRRGVWEYDVGYMPVTPRENRYLRLHDRLALGKRAVRYLRRRPDLSGGVSIEEDWPRGPYLLVRLTRDRALHTRRLRRLVRFPRNLRTVRVARSERELRRIQDRIDFDAHTADGFHVSSTGVDIDAGTVVVELITERTDHLEYFRARYGPAVTTEVIATTLTSPACATLYGYRPSADGMTLAVSYESGGGAEFDHVEVVEHAGRVEVAVVVQRPNGIVTADSRVLQQTVALASALGSRRVVDTTTGKRLPRGRVR